MAKTRARRVSSASLLDHPRGRGNGLLEGVFSFLATPLPVVVSTVDKALSRGSAALGHGAEHH